jgi:23S rRNA pseudouridine2605 synthase
MGGRARPAPAGACRTIAGFAEQYNRDMPPRYAYWTILIDNKPTAFRAAKREELQPTFAQLKRTNSDVTMKWFARGRLWDNPEQAEWAGRNTDRPAEKRGRDWRPGGSHRDPRAQFDRRAAERPRDRPPKRDGDRPADRPHRPPRPDRDRAAAPRDTDRRATPPGAPPPHQPFSGSGRDSRAPFDRRPSDRPRERPAKRDGDRPGERPHKPHPDRDRAATPRDSERRAAPPGGPPPHRPAGGKRPWDRKPPRAPWQRDRKPPQMRAREDRQGPSAPKTDSHREPTRRAPGGRPHAPGGRPPWKSKPAGGTGHRPSRPPSQPSADRRRKREPEDNGDK